ncbi:MAG: hypothetical protein ABIR79_04440, partial [Candidatus Binatia bacterium]
MMRRFGMVLAAMTLAVALSACGDNDNDDNSNGNDNDGGGTTPTPRVTATTARSAVPTPSATSGTSPVPSPSPSAHPETPCPEMVTYTVVSEGSDLDVGWTGIYHDTILGSGGSLSFALDCAGQVLGECGDCALTGPIASTTVVDNQRCTNGTQTTCTGDAECGTGTCEFFFGAPLPILGGGVPVCVVNQVNGPVTGAIQPELGTGTSDIGIIFTTFVGISADQPCPVCTGATLGATGTCLGGARDNEACTTHTVVPNFGNTSFDCPPSPSADIGASTLPLNLTTGTREIS